MTSKLSDKHLVIIDASCFYYSIGKQLREWEDRKVRILTKQASTGNIINPSYDDLVKCLLRGINDVKCYLPSVSVDTEAVPLWVLDKKDSRYGGYWRHEHLLDEYGIVYKTGRTKKSETVAKLPEFFRQQGYPYIQTEGLEADDLAGLVCRLCSSDDRLPKRITLLTLDTDWLGLITNPSEFSSYPESSSSYKHYLNSGMTVDWYSISPFKPRYRHNADMINRWLKRRKYSQTVKAPSELWDIKAEYGDKSDSLPPNSPIGVIDLLEPSLDPLADPDSRDYYLSLLLQLSEYDLGNHEHYGLLGASKAMLNILGFPHLPLPYYPSKQQC